MPLYRFINISPSSTPMPSNIGGILKKGESRTLDLRAAQVDTEELSEILAEGLLSVEALSDSPTTPDAVEVGSLAMTGSGGEVVVEIGSLDDLLTVPHNQFGTWTHNIGTKAKRIVAIDGHGNPVHEDRTSTVSQTTRQPDANTFEWHNSAWGFTQIVYFRLVFPAGTSVASTTVPTSEVVVAVEAG